MTLFDRGSSVTCHPPSTFSRIRVLFNMPPCSHLCAMSMCYGATLGSRIRPGTSSLTVLSIRSGVFKYFFLEQKHKPISLGFQVQILRLLNVKDTLEETSLQIYRKFIQFSADAVWSSDCARQTEPAEAEEGAITLFSTVHHDPSRQLTQRHLQP